MNCEIVKDQLVPYKTLFDPEAFIIASLKHVPEWVKKKLEGKGVILVDDFHPKDNGVIEFRELLRRHLDAMICLSPKQYHIPTYQELRKKKISNLQAASAL